MADIANTRDLIRAYATEQFIPEFVTNQYTRSPLLQRMTGQKGSDRELRPVGDGLTGKTKGTLVGGGSMSRAKRMAVTGGESVSWGVQKGTSVSVKNLTSRDTAATLANPTTNSQDQQKKMTTVRLTHKQVECLVWNSTAQANQGEYKIMSAIDDALGIAMQEIFDSLITELYVGSPTDQESEYWSEQIGIDNVCKTSGFLYGIDRTGTFFDGKRVTSAKAKALALIDDANITQGIQDKGEGVDLCLVNKTAYLTIKAEALTKGGTVIHKSMPEAVEYGMKQECILYGNVLVTYDPGLLDYSAISTFDSDLSNAVFMTKIGDWCFQTCNDKNFSVGEFVDLSKFSVGGHDARRALIDLQYRFWVFHPKNSIMYTAVTA